MKSWWMILYQRNILNYTQCLFHVLYFILSILLIQSKRQYNIKLKEKKNDKIINYFLGSAC